MRGSVIVAFREGKPVFASSLPSTDLYACLLAMFLRSCGCRGPDQFVVVTKFSALRC